MSKQKKTEEPSQQTLEKEQSDTNKNRDKEVANNLDTLFSIEEEPHVKDQENCEDLK